MGHNIVPWGLSFGPLKGRTVCVGGTQITQQAASAMHTLLHSPLPPIVGRAGGPGRRLGSCNYLLASSTLWPCGGQARPPSPRPLG